MELIINKRVLDCSKTHIMGILNVTPDSFSDGGSYCTLSQAIDHAATMIAHGAALIDIGGESTRPGAEIISDEEELERVIPVVYAIKKRFDTFISINTSSALVIRECAAIGVHLINDVRSLVMRESMQAAVSCQLPVCLVHMQGNPRTMQDSPVYFDVISEVNNYFTTQIIRCESFGIMRNKLLLDPGFGFGKNLAHNYKLLANLEYFHHFGLPLLIGVSRKSMLGINQCNKNPRQRLIGSVTGAVIAAIKGVQIVRVHDVKETAEALQVVQTMRNHNS